MSFYLACGFIASFAHAYFNMGSAVPALGASGAIAGVLGAYAATFPKAKVTILILIVIIPFFFKVPALAYALVWFGFQFLAGFVHLASEGMGSGIAWWARIGGFLQAFTYSPALAVRNPDHLQTRRKRVIGAAGRARVPRLPLVRSTAEG